MQQVQPLPGSSRESASHTQASIGSFLPHSVVSDRRALHSVSVCCKMSDFKIFVAASWAACRTSCSYDVKKCDYGAN